MATIKDCVFLELALRKGDIPCEKLEQGKAAQSELGKFGISKPLGAILVEKGIATKEAVAEIAEEMGSYSIRCQACGRPSPLAEADRNGNLKCKHCQAPIAYTTDRISEDDLSFTLKSGNGGRGEARGGKAKREARPGPSASHAPPGPGPGKWDTMKLGGGAQDDLTPRREVSKFHLEKLVGISPCGKLYRISDGGSPASLKVLDRVLCAEKAQFKKWVDFMQRVQDLPRSVSLKPVQLFKEGSTSYTTRPFLGGPESSLSARLASRDEELLSAEGVRECALCLLRSLLQFHAAHFVHGNLKPVNVILTEEGACLTDPGLHLLFDGLPPEERALRLSDASRYVAPEVLQGAEPTPASDVFSAGRILDDVLAAHADAKSANASAAAPSIWLAPVVSRMTSLDPTERPPSAKEALRALEAAAQEKPAARPAAAAKAPRKTAPAAAWISGKLGLQVAGHALLALAVVTVVYQFVAWYGARRAFASPARGDELTSWVVSREIDTLRRWTTNEAQDRSEAQKRWGELAILFQGTPWEERVRAASSAALGHLQNPAERELTAALADAQAGAEKKQWAAALDALLRVEARIEGSSEAKELLGKVLEGLYQDEHMVFVPRAPARKSEKAAQAQLGPFLVDAAPVKRSVYASYLAAHNVPDAGRGSSADGPLTGIPLADAEKLAQSLGKRVPTAAEWDRMATFAREKTPSWAAAWATKLDGLDGRRGSLSEWVSSGDDDDLGHAGFGCCRGGDRPGVPVTHPLRRKKSVGHPDVGVRLVRSLRS